MKRQDAVALVNAAMNAPDGVVWCSSRAEADKVRAEKLRECEKFVDAMVALGMLKLDEPKDARDKFWDLVTGTPWDQRYASTLLLGIDAAGLKIVEK